MVMLRKSAFPIHPEAHEKSDHELDLLMGMQLRDYFAAKAMQGMLAYPGGEGMGSHHLNNTADGVAMMAYRYADAMIAARETK